MKISNKLRSIEGGGLIFFCPGCKSGHMIRHGEGPGPRWTWNGDADRPTFSPSVLVTYSGSDAGKDGAPPAVCHTFVTDGRIQFLSDCSHELAGQTVELPDLPERRSIEA